MTLLGGAPTIAPELARIDLAGAPLEVLAHSIPQLPATSYLSVPLAISYPSANGRTAHAFYYAPANPDYAPLPDELPPLIVIGHGGPTSMATSTLKLATQYWTSRGFAVLDVNYGGSTRLRARLPRPAPAPVGRGRRRGLRGRCAPPGDHRARSTRSAC